MLFLRVYKILHRIFCIALYSFIEKTKEVDNPLVFFIILN